MAASSSSDKTIRDPENDPYPRRRYKNGQELFEEKYASEFFAQHPEFAGVKFSDLKKKCAALVAHIAEEFKTTNVDYKRRVAEWEQRWPKEALLRNAVKTCESTERRERKRRAEEKRRAATDTRQRIMHVPRADDDDFLEVANETVSKLMEHQAVAADIARQIVDRISWLAKYRRSAEQQKHALLRPRDDSDASEEED